LVGSLEEIVARGDRAALAKLRRGLGKDAGAAPDRDIWVYAHLHGAAPEHEEPATLVASLYALWHQGGGDFRRAARTLGGSFRQLRDATDSGSVEKRFVALLDSEAEDLPHRLRQAVSLLKSKGIPVNWLQLLEDLLRWESPRRPVQRRWAREFWAAQAADEVKTENVTASTEGGTEE
jgi:CRISPR system Cascade subunit CasB